jgi:hypothetical protein
VAELSAFFTRTSVPSKALSDQIAELKAEIDNAGKPITQLSLPDALSRATRNVIQGAVAGSIGSAAFFPGATALASEGIDKALLQSSKDRLKELLEEQESLAKQNLLSLQDTVKDVNAAFKLGNARTFGNRRILNIYDDTARLRREQQGFDASLLQREQAADIGDIQAEAATATSFRGVTDAQEKLIDKQGQQEIDRFKQGLDFLRQNGAGIDREIQNVDDILQQRREAYPQERIRLAESELKKRQDERAAAVTPEQIAEADSAVAVAETKLRLYQNPKTEIDEAEFKAQNKDFFDRKDQLKLNKESNERDVEQGEKQLKSLSDAISKFVKDLKEDNKKIRQRQEDFSNLRALTGYAESDSLTQTAPLKSEQIELQATKSAIDLDFSDDNRQLEIQIGLLDESLKLLRKRTDIKKSENNLNNNIGDQEKQALNQLAENQYKSEETLIEKRKALLRRQENERQAAIRIQDEQRNTERKRRTDVSQLQSNVEVSQIRATSGIGLTNEQTRGRLSFSADEKLRVQEKLLDSFVKERDDVEKQIERERKAGNLDAVRNLGERRDDLNVRIGEEADKLDVEKERVEALKDKQFLESGREDSRDRSRQRRQARQDIRDFKRGDDRKAVEKASEEHEAKLVSSGRLGFSNKSTGDRGIYDKQGPSAFQRELLYNELVRKQKERDEQSRKPSKPDDLASVDPAENPEVLITQNDVDKKLSKSASDLSDTSDELWDAGTSLIASSGLLDGSAGKLDAAAQALIAAAGALQNRGGGGGGGAGGGVGGAGVGVGGGVIPPVGNGDDMIGYNYETNYGMG